MEEGGSEGLGDVKRLARVAWRSYRCHVPLSRRGLRGIANATPARQVRRRSPRGPRQVLAWRCHNEKLKTANLTLDKLDLARLGDHVAEAEKVCGSSGRMMPPGGVPRTIPPHVML
jgi:hypothetical protein